MTKKSKQTLKMGRKIKKMSPIIKTLCYFGKLDVQKHRGQNKNNNSTWEQVVVHGRKRSKRFWFFGILGLLLVIGIVIFSFFPDLFIGGEDVDIFSNGKDINDFEQHADLNGLSENLNENGTSTCCACTGLTVLSSVIVSGIAIATAFNKAFLLISTGERWVNIG